MKDIELNSLSGGWQLTDERSLPYRMSPADQRYFNFYGHVEKCFFGDGENLFTKRAVTAYNYDGHSDRPAKIPKHGGLGFRERAGLFH